MEVRREITFPFCSVAWFGTFSLAEQEFATRKGPFQAESQMAKLASNGAFEGLAHSILVYLLEFLFFLQALQLA